MKIYDYLPKVSEGQRRLRLWLSVVASVGAFSSLALLDYRVDGEDLAGYGLLSLASAVIVYGLVTSIYWVLEGFEIQPVSQIERSNVHGLNVESNIVDENALFPVLYRASTDLFETLKLQTGSLREASNENPLGKLFSVAIDSFEYPSLAYCYGLLLIAMENVTPGFHNSNVEKRLRAKTVRKLIELDQMNSKQAGLVSSRDSAYVSRISESLEAVIAEVQAYRYSNPNTSTSRLQPLNEFVAQMTGLQRPEDREALIKAGKRLLAQMNSEIRDLYR